MGETMMRIGGLLVALGLSMVIPAYAQQPAPMTCEERVAILTQLVDDLSVARRTVEIEHAALKAKRVVVPPQKDTKHGADQIPAQNQNP